MKRLTENELKQIDQAIIVMVRVGNELNWKGPVIDEFYVHSINELRAIRDCRRTKRAAGRARFCPEGLHEALVKMTGFKHCGYCGERLNR